MRFYRYCFTLEEAEAEASKAIARADIINTKIEWAGSCGGYNLYIQKVG